MLKTPAMKLCILDRDGTINVDRDDYVKSAVEWEPLPGALEAIARISAKYLPVATVVLCRMVLGAISLPA